MWLTDRTLLQMYVTFCEYLVFREFRRCLHITLAKYLEQEHVAVFVFFFVVFYPHAANRSQSGGTSLIAILSFMICLLSGLPSRRI